MSNYSDYGIVCKCQYKNVQKRENSNVQKEEYYNVQKCTWIFALKYILIVSLTICVFVRKKRKNDKI